MKPQGDTSRAIIKVFIQNRQGTVVLSHHGAYCRRQAFSE